MSTNSETVYHNQADNREIDANGHGEYRKIMILSWSDVLRTWYPMIVIFLLACLIAVTVLYYCKKRHYQQMYQNVASTDVSEDDDL